MPFTHLVDEDIPLVHHSVGQTEESWRVQLELDSHNYFDLELMDIFFGA